MFINMILSIVFGGVIGIVLIFLIRKWMRWTHRDDTWFDRRAVVITGCDSGLGYSLAHWCHGKGMVVIAACHGQGGHGNLGGDNLEKLGQDCGRIHVIRNFNVTDVKCIENLQDQVSKILMETRSVLHGVINNAGTLVLAKLEWQTHDMIESQLMVNLRGSISMSKTFLPLLKKTNGSRIINISSPAADTRLPLTSVYSASKAGLEAFSDALSSEIEDDQVHVIVLSPPSSSLFLKTSIGSKQNDYYKAMENNMMNGHVEQFQKVKSMMSYIKKPSLEVIEDPSIFSAFEDALVSSCPLNKYSCSNNYDRLKEITVKYAPSWISSKIKRNIVKIL